MRMKNGVGVARLLYMGVSCDARPEPDQKLWRLRRNFKLASSSYPRIHITELVTNLILVYLSCAECLCSLNEDLHR